MSRPGFLTQEFFAGRRERYLPPFRLYLVISVVLFALVPLLPSSLPVSVDMSPDEGVTPAEACQDFARIESQSALQGLARRVVDGLKHACLDIASNNASRLSAAFLHNVPRMMFVLLPLVALMATLLYWRPRRFYVEHLLLQVHNHACLFVVLSLLAVVNLIPGAGAFTDWLLLPYLLWYVYVAQRRYYGQGPGRTLAKLLALGLCYLALGSLLLATTGVISALQL